MLLDQVPLKFRVAVVGGLEDYLPLFARAELALMPEDACHRTGDLTTGRETGLDGRPGEFDPQFLVGDRHLYLPDLGHAVEATETGLLPLK